MSQNRRPRVSLPLSSIEQEFQTQLKFLRRSCNEFDLGDSDEFRRIALALRILLHDKGQSKSLAGQVGLKGGKFLAYGYLIDERNLLSEHPLAGMRMAIKSGAGEATYFPVMDDDPECPVRQLPFEIWWTEVVFRSMSQLKMSRSDFILNVADSAGGAHVDPSIDADYHSVAHENAVGWAAFSGEQRIELEGIERAYVRHIGFEVLKTLDAAWAVLLGNRGCDCGSGRKRRYCCGKL
jgi:hypothetical protein